MGHSAGLLSLFNSVCSIISTIAAVLLIVSFIILIVVKMIRLGKQTSNTAYAPAKHVIYSLVVDIHVPAIMFFILISYHFSYLADQSFNYPTFAFFSSGQPIFWITLAFLVVIIALRLVHHIVIYKLLRIILSIVVIILFGIWVNLAASINRPGNSLSLETAKKALIWRQDPDVIYRTDYHHLRAVELWAERQLEYNK